MRVYFDEEVVCPHCGHEDVAWQITTETRHDDEMLKKTGRLIIDTICRNQECKNHGRIYRDMKQPEYEWIGKHYTVWYLNGGTFREMPLNTTPKKVEGELINVISPFTGHIMIEDENKALHMIPFASIVLMELKTIEESVMLEETVEELSFDEVLRRAKTQDFTGDIKDIGMKFKFLNGRMYTWNKVQKEWVAPRVTTSWREYTYVVTYITRVDKGALS